MMFLGFSGLSVMAHEVEMIRDVRLWPFASFLGYTPFGRFRGEADINGRAARACSDAIDPLQT